LNGLKLSSYLKKNDSFYNLPVILPHPMKNNDESDELMLVNKALAFEVEQKEKRTAELAVANEELAIQNKEKEKRLEELTIANIELAFQNSEREKRAAELILANKELLYQNEEKGKRAAELILANIELAFQTMEKAKRAAELIVANKEHAYQSEEKEKRASELSLLNKELVFQNEEKGKRSAELVIANAELAYQNEEKGKRSAELIIANKELAYQNEEKGKRSAELIVANKELAFQNEEKGKRAAELVVANNELAFQNEEKEKRALELIMVNKELEQFAFIASHDLQQPLRTVANYVQLFEEKYLPQLDDDAHKYLRSVNSAISRMNLLIKSLMTFSQLGNNKTLTSTDCKKVIGDVLEDLETLIKTTGTLVEVSEMPVLNIYETEMHQLFQNLLTNAIKFQKPGQQPIVKISAVAADGKWLFCVADNGIGIDHMYKEKVFDIFQRLHTKKEFEGSGIGLANCKKIVQLHQGEIWLESEKEKGTQFYFTISNLLK